jgi:glutathione S-transferase
MSLVLYANSSYTSPYALSAFVALTEKGLPFTLETLDLEAGANLLPAYRDLSLTTRIPALVHDDFVLTESSAICEYLDEAFPAPGHPALLPPGLRQRARARQLQAWLRSDFLPLRGERDTTTVFYQPATEPLGAAARAGADKLIHAAEVLLDGNGEHLFGAWCVADTDLAMMLQRLIKNGDAVPARLRDYAAAQWQRDSVQQWLRLLPIY